MDFLYFAHLLLVYFWILSRLLWKERNPLSAKPLFRKASFLSRKF